MKEDLSRRRLLLGGAAISAGAVLAGCTSNDTKNDGTSGQTKGTGGDNASPGKT